MAREGRLNSVCPLQRMYTVHSVHCMYVQVCKVDYFNRVSFILHRVDIILPQMVLH